jgi:hypothetical protein
VLPADGMPPSVRENVSRHRERLHEQIQPLIEWSLRRLGSEHVDAEVMTEMMIACFEQAARMTLTDPDRFTPERLLAFIADFIATHKQV